MNIFVGIIHRLRRAFLPALSVCCAVSLWLLGGLTPISVHAQSETTVYDYAGIMSESAEKNIADSAKKLIKDSGVDAVICTVNSLDGIALDEYAKKAFEDFNAGIGKDKDGILLLISFDAMHSGKGEREIYFYTHGYAKNGGFNEYGIDRITELITPKLSGGDYEGACEEWLSLSGKFLKAAKNGDPYSSDHRYKTVENYLAGLLVSFIIGLAAAAGACFIMIRMMRTTMPKYDNTDYVKKDSFRVTKQRDIYVYSTVKRMKRESAAKKTIDGIDK